MQKIVKKIILIIFIISILLLIALEGFYFYLKNKEIISISLPKIEQISKKIEEVGKILTPGPLKVQIAEPEAFLTRDGVLEWTNNHRKENGLPSLTINLKLNLAAEKKMRDMFENQYFEHVSPEGVGPEDVIKSVGYDYKVIGENLALGNFKDDMMLVQAWMDSPGHRENILNKNFTEIGIVTGKAEYKGEVIWMAVQEFGKPLPICDAPNQETNNKILFYKNQIESIKAQAEALNRELNKKQGKNPANIEEFNKKVDQYNALILEYKTLVEELNKLIKTYNEEVSQYNTCINQ